LDNIYTVCTYKL